MPINTNYMPVKSLEVLLLEAKIKLDTAKAEYDALADRARAELSMGSHTDGLAEVVIGVNRQWNKAKALETYGTEICSMQVDLKVAKDKMTGAQFESFYVESAPKVTVKMVNEK